MAAVCAARASQRLARSAVQLPTIYRRNFTSYPSLLAADSKSTSGKPDVPQVKRGSLASGSIFAEDDDGPALPTTDGRAPRRWRRQNDDDEIIEEEALEERDRTHMDNALNPFPERRARWERKMVIRSIQRRGRLTRQEKIMQSERESTTKSHWFKTSVKKLVKLTHQVAGKNIDDAILQMRFSKKKAAKDVKALLEQAKNEAIVARGMGMGSVQQKQAVEGKEGGEEGKDGKKETPFKAVTIALKDGTRKKITDPTSIYIDQAWVNRGPFGIDYDHRARGAVNMLRPPHTGMTVILKEEKTRIREAKDREEKKEKKLRKDLWTQLPDRKIIGQNQYYSW